VLVAVALTESNMNGQIDARLMRDAPTWFFIDIQPDQRQQFADMTAAAVGAENVHMVPMVRGRVVALAGVPSEQIKAPSSEAWILNGDRSLTWASAPPKNNIIVKGDWWPENYRGPPLVSMDDEAMIAFGLKLGDLVTLNIAGREMEARLTSSREIEWGSLGLNFVFILSPGIIDKSPHNWVAAVYTDDLETEAAIDRDIARIMPNVSSVSVREAANTAGRILGLVSTAVRITAAITLIAGFAVLAGTVAASESRRIHTATILKVLGAERRVILSSYIAEYAILGGVTAIVAIIIGGVACWVLMTGFLNSSFTFPLLLAVQVTGGGMIATVTLGLVGAARSLTRKPGSVLRDE
jgi:putative ABC transport system permease protein